MKAKSYDADSLRTQFENQHANNVQRGTKTSFIKLSKAITVLRLLPTTPLFMHIVKRTMKVDDRWTSIMDWGFLLANPALLEAAAAAGKITGEDIAQANTFGDPFTTIGRAAKDLGVEDKQLSGIWGRTRYLWNAINKTTDPDTVGLFESSKLFFEQVMDLYLGTEDPEDKDSYIEEPIDIFDPVEGFDIMIKGNGKDGLQRRYNPPKEANKPTPVELEWEDEAYDLMTCAVKAVVPWKVAAKAALAAHEELAAQVGITADTWGV